MNTTLPTATSSPGAPPFAPASHSSLGPGAFESAKGVDFRHLWHTVLEKLWILVLCFLAGLFLAIGYLARTPKLYQGHVVLEVDIQEPTLVRSDDGASRMRSAFLASQDALRTIEQNLTNRTLLARVIRAEGLAEDNGRALLGQSKGVLPAPKKDTRLTPTASESALTQMEEALGDRPCTMANPVVLRGTRRSDLYVVDTHPSLAQRPADAPALVERRRDVSQVEAALATFSQRYKEKHPRMIAAKAALNEVRSALKQTVLQQPAVLKNAIEQARATENSLRAGAGEQEKAALALNKAAIGYQELARQADTDRALYESVLRQIKETDLTKGTKTNAVSVIEHSPLPSAPVSPNPMKAIALGLLGGIAAGLGTIFGLNALDRSIKTVDQAEATFGLPVLAAIPEISRSEATSDRPESEAPEGTSSYRLVAEAPEGPAAEAFRKLRASLSLLGPEAERKVFLFTSALPNEGKCFTSPNY